MKIYTDKSATPLKYHTFLQFFILPLQIILSVGAVYEVMTVPWAISNPINLADYGFFALWGVCAIFCLAGAFMKNRLFLYSLGAYMLSGIGYWLVLAALSANYDSILIVTAGMGVMIVTPLCVLTAIYYYKRRKLFMPDKQSEVQKDMYEEDYEQYRKAEEQFLEQTKKEAAESMFMDSRSGMGRSFSAGDINRKRASEYKVPPYNMPVDNGKEVVKYCPECGCKCDINTQNCPVCSTRV